MNHQIKSIMKPIMKKALFSSAFAFVSAICFAQNPIINTSYTPDPAPFVHGNKLYLFTGHDEDDATYFKMNDWQVFSTEDRARCLSPKKVLSTLT